MSTNTSRLGLLKPDNTETVNVVTQINNNLDTLDLNINFRSCTSSTRPSTVWDGLAIHETDTNKQYIWNNAPATSGWYEIYGSGGAITQLNLSGSATGSFTLNSKVSGDSNNRYQVRADGVQCYGSGSGAVDTFLYRNGTNSMKTDGAFTVAGSTTVQSTTDSTALNVSGGATIAKSLTVGQSASLGGAQGVLALGNITTAPTATSPGLQLASDAGRLLLYNQQNNAYYISGSQAGTTVSNLSATTTETTLISIVIPANEITNDSVYRLRAFGNLSMSATASTMTIRTKLNGTTMLSSGAATTTASIVTKQWTLDTTFRFRSPGASCVCYNQMMLWHRWDNSNTPTTTPCIHDSHATGVTFSSTSAVTLAISAQWGASSASNILTTQGYYWEKVV